MKKKGNQYILTVHNTKFEKPSFYYHYLTFNSIKMELQRFLSRMECILKNPGDKVSNDSNIRISCIFIFQLTLLYSVLLQ